MKNQYLESLLKDIDSLDFDDNNTVIEENTDHMKKRVVEYLIQHSPRSFTSLSSLFFLRDDETIQEAVEKALRLMPEVSPPADFSQSYVLYKQSRDGQYKKNYVVVADTKALISSLYEDDDVMYITNNALYFKNKEIREVKLTCFVLFLVALFTVPLLMYYKLD